MRFSLFLSALLIIALAGCDAGEPALTEAGAKPPPGTANPIACANRNNDTADKLTDCVTIDGVRAHQSAFQEIADANGGTRADNTPGYTESADYVVATLQAAGWNVQRVPFEYDVVESALEQLAPVAATYATGTFTGTGFGDVTGTVIPVDLSLDFPELSTSGCEASDFAGLDFSGPNDIALIQRSVCFFSVKAANAEAAGAEAVIIFNQGNTPEREGLITGNASAFPDGSPSNLGIPLVGASFADGISLAQAGSTARVSAESVTRTSENVIAESQTGDPNHVVMIGAHLDSVVDGPGINDNASGSAAILETAVMMRRAEPVNMVRLAFWGAEELGLIGSTAYLDGLSSAERDAISLYLNFDMIGSPNFVRFVYDGDGSEFGFPGAPGSAAAESFFEAFYTDRDVDFEPTFITGSDHTPFDSYGIATGGLFTGAGGIKTAEQAAIYGGLAGEQFDPCYHLACDTIDNVNLGVLDLNADAVAAATLHFAMAPATDGARTQASAEPRAPVARSEHVPRLHAHGERVAE